MVFEGDAIPQFRKDACCTIYALIADALYRCTTQSVATRIIVKIYSLSPSAVPSVSPMYLFSVANSGPVMKKSELRNFFPQFRKPFNSNSSTQLDLRWSGVVRVLTADVGDNDFYQYEMVMRSDNRFDTTQLPRTEYETELDSGTVREIIVAGGVHELLEFSRSICEKCLIPFLLCTDIHIKAEGTGSIFQLADLQDEIRNSFEASSKLRDSSNETSGNFVDAQNINIDVFLQGVHIDDTGHHIKSLRICDSTRALGDFTSEELLCVGAVEYLSSCRCGFREGSIADLRFRELVQVGKSHAGSSETKWSLDACVVLIDENMANEIFPTVDSQASVVAYFEDGCYTFAPVSVLKGLSNVKWGKFGLKIKDMQIADSGESRYGQDLVNKTTANMSGTHIECSRFTSHCHLISGGIRVLNSELQTQHRSSSLAGERKVKAAAEACMTDLKARFSELFLSEHAIQLQKIAVDVSECIAGIICLSTNEEFQDECTSILRLPRQNLAEVGATIRTRMFEIIQQQDGRKKRKPRENVSEDFANEFAYMEDEEEPLNYDNEDEDTLYYEYENDEYV